MHSPHPEHLTCHTVSPGYETLSVALDSDDEEGIGRARGYGQDDESDDEDEGEDEDDEEAPQGVALPSANGPASSKVRVYTAQYAAVVVVSCACRAYVWLLVKAPWGGAAARACLHSALLWLGV